MKKVWEKPELVVLVRGKTEESVLASCKGGGVIAAVITGKGSCYVLDTCSKCSAIVTT